MSTDIPSLVTRADDRGLQEIPLTARLAALQALHVQMIVLGDREAAHGTMVRSVRRLVGCDCCALYVLEPDGGLRLAGADGFDGPLPERLALDDGRAAAAQAFSEEYLVHIADFCDATGGRPPLAGVRSEVAVAVSSSRGPIGVFDFCCRRAHGFSDQDIHLCRLAADQTAFSLENLRLLRELTATRDAVIHGMALLAESRDGSIGGHLVRICAYARTLAERMRRESAYRQVASDDWIETIARAVALHDIGKVGIPDTILLKPGQLTASEYAVMQTHTTIGGQLLEQLMRSHGSFPMLRLGAEVALGHHERWDGTGYPRGQAAETIPLPARLAAICDVYDALTSERVYKRASSDAEACAYLRRRAGTRFDPRLTALFLELAPRLEAIRRGNPD